MPQKSVWAAIPKSVRAPPTTGQQVLIVPAGGKCKHGLTQPQSGLTLNFCFKCTFVCKKCGENTNGICDTADCKY